MPKDANWTSMERLFNSFPLPYPIMSILFSLVLYIIYIFLELKIDNSIISKQRLIMAIEIGVIAYQLCGNLFILAKMKSIFLNLGLIKNNNFNKFLSALKIRFTSNYYYYLVLILVIIPFYLINWKNPCNLISIELPYYSIYYIYVYFFLGFLWLSLLGNILWTIINITWDMNDTANDSADFNSFLSIFAFDNKIKSIRNSIIQVLVYYFIDIALIILFYLNPLSIGKYEITMLVVLLLIGIVLFFISLNAIQKIRNSRLEFEYDPIDRKIQEQNQKLIFMLDESDCIDIDQINFRSSALDLLRKQRDDLTKLDRSVYDFGTVGAFITSFLIPALSLIDKIKPQLMDFFNSQMTMINIYMNNSTHHIGLALLINL
jgi:hypothetical protein